MTKTKKLRRDGWFRYSDNWGNYRSDKHKSKRILSSEIASIMVHANFTKKELIEIRDYVKKKAFSEFM